MAGVSRGGGVRGETSGWRFLCNKSICATSLNFSSQNSCCFSGRTAFELKILLKINSTNKKTVKHFFTHLFIIIITAWTNDIDAVIKCYASSSWRGGNYQSLCCSYGPSSFHDFCGQLPSCHATHGACAPGYRSSWYGHHVGQPCGRDPPEWPQSIYRLNPGQSSKSWALEDHQGSAQHAPKMN